MSKTDTNKEVAFEDAVKALENLLSDISWERYYEEDTSVEAIIEDVRQMFGDYDKAYQIHISEELLKAKVEEFLAAEAEEIRSQIDDLEDECEYYEKMEKQCE